MHLLRGLVFRETDSRRGTGGSDQGAFHQAGRGGERVSFFLVISTKGVQKGRSPYEDFSRPSLFRTLATGNFSSGVFICIRIVCVFLFKSI